MTSSNNILGEKLYEGRGGKLLEGKHTSIHRNGIAGDGLQILWSDIEKIYIGGQVDSINGIPSGEDRSITLVDSHNNEISLEFIAVFRMKQENRNQFEDVYAFILKNISGTQWAKFMQIIKSGGNYSFGNFYIAQDGFYFSKVVSTWRGAKEAFDKIEKRYVKKGIISNGTLFIQYQDPNKKLKLKTQGVGEVRYIPNVHIIQSYISYINTTIQPKELPTINFFKPYPNTLALALIRPLLFDMLPGKGIHGETLKVYPIPKLFRTPYGNYKYVNSSKLGLLPIVCIKETGAIIHAQVRASYVEHILTTLTARLNLDLESLFQTIIRGELAIIAGMEAVDPPILMYSTVQEVLESITSPQIPPSEPSIIRDMDLSLYSTTEALNPLKTPTDEYFFSYWATTNEPSTMFNLKMLEGVAASCLDDGLVTLRSDGEWPSSFLKPTFAYIRAKLIEDRGNAE